MKNKSGIKRPPVKCNVFSLQWSVRPGATFVWYCHFSNIPQGTTLITCSQLEMRSERQYRHRTFNSMFHHHGDSHYSDLRGASPADTAVVALYTSKSFPFSLDSSDESFWFTATFSSITCCNISFMDLQSRGLVMESVPGKFIFLHFYSKDDHIKKLKGLTHNAHSKLFLNGMRASYHLVLSLFVVLKVLRPSYTCWMSIVFYSVRWIRSRICQCKGFF